MNPLNATDEKALLLRLRDGDYAAFDRLYDAHANITLTKLKKLVHIREVAEELHQDVFMKVWERREQLPIDVPFRAVVYRIAKSAAYNFYRKAAHDDDLRKQLIHSASELYDQLEDYINFKETNEAISAAIAKLPFQRQKIFTAIKTDGKSYAETAAEFGVSLSTVKDHMAKAMRFLRIQLANDAPASLFLVITASLFK